MEAQGRLAGPALDGQNPTRQTGREPGDITATTSPDSHCGYEAPQRKGKE